MSIKQDIQNIFNLPFWGYVFFLTSTERGMKREGKRMCSVHLAPILNFCLWCIRYIQLNVYVSTVVKMANYSGLNGDRSSVNSKVRMCRLFAQYIFDIRISKFIILQTTSVEALTRTCLHLFSSNLWRKQ